MLTIPHISAAERGIITSWISWATGRTIVGGIARLRVSDAKRDVVRNRRIDMEYCRMYQNDGKIKGVAVELSSSECLVVMDALKNYTGSEKAIAEDMLKGFKRACDEQEE